MLKVEEARLQFLVKSRWFPKEEGKSENKNDQKWPLRIRTEGGAKQHLQKVDSESR